MSIIRQEEQHLKEISDELKGVPAMAWTNDVCEIEAGFYASQNAFVESDVSGVCTV